MNQVDKKIPGNFKELCFKFRHEFREIIAKPLYIVWAEDYFAAKFWWENHLWYAHVMVRQNDQGTYSHTNPDQLKEAIWKKFGESRYTSTGMMNFYD